MKCADKKMLEPIIVFLASLPKESFTSDFMKDIWALSHIASANPKWGEDLLTLLIELMLRTNSELAQQAPIMLRDFIDDHVISIERALEICERWEMNPVKGYSPYLSESFYEHLFDEGEKERAFLKWKKHPVLRKKFFEVCPNRLKVRNLGTQY